MINKISQIPQNLYLEVTTECNLRCKHCHLWMSVEPAGTLTTSEKENIIDEFARINRNGTVVLTGGEPMLKTEEFFRLIRRSRELGLSTNSVSNASLLVEDEIIARTMEDGPRALFLSLDSHESEVHDYIRGQKGTFARTVSAIRKLVAYRESTGLKEKRSLFINTVIFDLNIDKLRDVITFARDLHVDGINFQMLGRTFWNQSKKDVFFEKHFFRNKEVAKERLRDMQTEFGGDPFVITHADDFKWMGDYIEEPDFIGENICASHYRNIIVNSWGDIQLCFNMSTLFPEKPFPNIRERGIAELWNSDSAGEVRKVMDDCRKNCGMLNCHRKK